MHFMNNKTYFLNFNIKLALNKVVLVIWLPRAKLSGYSPMQQSGVIRPVLTYTMLDDKDKHDCRDSVKVPLCKSTLSLILMNYQLWLLVTQLVTLSTW